MSSEFVIVTRHSGAVAWLAERGITGEVIAHVSDPSQVAGRAVIGSLPLHLATLTKRIGSIDMPGLRADQRGADLSPEEMDAAGAALSWYIVRRAEALEAKANALIGAADAAAAAYDEDSKTQESERWDGAARGAADAIRDILNG